MRAIPAPTPVEVSYAAMQKQEQILRRDLAGAEGAERRDLPPDVEASDAAHQGKGQIRAYTALPLPLQSISLSGTFWGR